MNDVHLERRYARKLSTSPDEKGRYKNIKVLLILSSENGGLEKLNIGSKTCNLLVTSSLRVDCESVNLGSTTTHFNPNNNTETFISKRSLELALEILNNSGRPQPLPFLYQLKRVRSKIRSYFDLLLLQKLFWVWNATWIPTLLNLDLSRSRFESAYS